MLESLRVIQQSHPRTIGSAQIIDDLGTPMGFIVVGGVDPNGYSFRMNR